MNVEVISCVGVLSRSVLFIVLYCANIFSKIVYKRNDSFTCAHWASLSVLSWSEFLSFLSRKTPQVLLPSACDD